MDASLQYWVKEQEPFVASAMYHGPSDCCCLGDEEEGVHMHDSPGTLLGHSWD